MPLTVNEPVGGKCATSPTTSVVWAPSIVWAPPELSTVVPVVEMTTPPSSALPVQPLSPVNLVSVLAVYTHVPVTPATVNVPLDAKPVVDFTLSSVGDVTS